ncbi:hypothetical protein Syun_024952 [Stephania yunnanensis]|uniref:Protein kinase domain-containing protein n=1 Tax=Stephania yunnanensis TaxID=152371 RepID=A0AAP0EW33_9MAGN
MCNQEIERARSLNSSSLDSNSSSSSAFSANSLAFLQFESETLAAPRRMESAAAEAAAAAAEEAARVKLLCSFGGSIMPRPQDGRLRYVGGETRMVSLPRDVNYEELMVRMRELFESAAVLKYQQPDEDLDALVSVVNDDDVTNMMEEYDKLGSGDGFTRLRMFLFPLHNNEQDPSALSMSSPHFVDSDERESERRYVDALNSLNDGVEFRKQQLGEPPLMDQLINVEFGVQTLPPLPPQFNLRHLTIPPHVGSGQQHQQPHTQRYNEMEAPWSPAYYSPRHHGHHDPRPVPEFPLSPSSGRYRMGFGESHDEFGRQSLSHQPQFEHHAHQAQIAQYEQHHPSFIDNVVWVPAGAIPSDKPGFPGNLGHAHNGFEGNSICDSCRMTFHRNQISPEGARFQDSRWVHGGQPHMEPPNAGTEFIQFPNSCIGCTPGRETYLLNPDANLELGVYSKDYNEPQSFGNDAYSNERGWSMHHHLNHRVEEARMQFSGVGRMNEHYVVDGSGMTVPLVHGNSGTPSNHDEPRLVGGVPELGNEGLHDQSVGAGSHIHVPAIEDQGVRYANSPAAYQISHGPAPAPALWIKMQNPMHSSPSYEALNMIPPTNGAVNSGFPRGMRDGSPNFRVGFDNPNSWTGQQQKVYAFDGPSGQGGFHGSASNIAHENHNALPPNPGRSPIEMCSIPTIPLEALPSQVHSSSYVNGDIAQPSPGLGPGVTDSTAAIGPARFDDNSGYGVDCVAKNVETRGATIMPLNVLVDDNELEKKKEQEAASDSNGLMSNNDDGESQIRCETGVVDNAENDELVKRFSFLPELIASVKKAALEGVEEVKDKLQQNIDDDDKDPASKEAVVKGMESENGQLDVEADSDNEHPKSSQIEPTKAEEEALARGLQTIKNDDLEEIRELGSGTYGSVYHGKWKGSDVAVKRIKSSCFAGKPSERERLIADFWKEAWILSSLHHPNVVSFYGIVRDGPDGTLATVTEFMINGSLKQFLQKKDRTIDRRKRLIIAMDAAFGMEYLHGKNIVHFDLKCENLLVNMRDPHRPVCKIGDLGLSKVKQHTLVSGGVRGTLPWMAPELLSGKSNMVTEKIDVYSFSIVMWELLTGEEPYADMHCASIIGGIVNNTLRPQIPSWCDPEWKSLMESCWASDPGERPSFAEIAQKLRKMSAAMNVK